MLSKMSFLFICLIITTSEFHNTEFTDQLLSTQTRKKKLGKYLLELPDYTRKLTHAYKAFNRIYAKYFRIFLSKYSLKSQTLGWSKTVK